MIGKDNPDELLDDLESIRDLLDDESPDADSPEDLGTEGAEHAATDVPLLDDVVQGTLEFDEEPAPDLAELDAAEGGLDENVIDALMGDSWKEAAQDILATARSAIETAASEWSPQQTDELARALEIRIDAAVHAALSDALADRFAGLRSDLLRVLRDTAEEFVKGLSAAAGDTQNQDQDQHGR